MAAVGACPFCGSPARWVALLEEGGAVGEQVKQEFERMIAQLTARAFALSKMACSEGIRRSRVRSATRRFLSPAEKMRAYRQAAARLGLCGQCCKRPVEPGYAQCAECRETRARAKRMRRHIEKSSCACGRPAVAVSAGEYVCARCKAIEAQMR